MSRHDRMTLQRKAENCIAAALFLRGLGAPRAADLYEQNAAYWFALADPIQTLWGVV